MGLGCGGDSDDEMFDFFLLVFLFSEVELLAHVAPPTRPWRRRHNPTFGGRGRKWQREGWEQDWAWGKLRLGLRLESS